jgi:hypothetical protein
MIKEGLKRELAKSCDVEIGNSGFVQTLREKHFRIPFRNQSGSSDPKQKTEITDPALKYFPVIRYAW